MSFIERHTINQFRSSLIDFLGLEFFTLLFLFSLVGNALTAVELE